MNCCLFICTFQRLPHWPRFHFARPHQNSSGEFTGNTTTSMLSIIPASSFFVWQSTSILPHESTDQPFVLTKAGIRSYLLSEFELYFMKFRLFAKQRIPIFWIVTVRSMVSTTSEKVIIARNEMSYRSIRSSQRFSTIVPIKLTPYISHNNARKLVITVRHTTCIGKDTDMIHPVAVHLYQMKFKRAQNLGHAMIGAKSFEKAIFSVSIIQLLA